MIEKPEKIKGRTYSLFGESETTDGFYEFTDKILNELLKVYKNEEELHCILQFSSKKRKRYKEFVESNIFLKESELQFGKYIYGVEEFIRKQSIFKIFEPDLKLKEWQYHLYMIEFVLTNRLYKDRFKKCDVKIALLPHCLRDLIKNCKAEKNEFDYQCRHCSKECFINEISRLLKKNNIEPYIWMSAKFNKVTGIKKFKDKSVGVLGIACIPQLIAGMRMCRKKNIPVIGLPLNANRCIRWMGDFYPNSIDLKELKKLLL